MPKATASPKRKNKELIVIPPQFVAPLRKLAKEQKRDFQEFADEFVNRALIRYIANHKKGATK